MFFCILIIKIAHNEVGDEMKKQSIWTVGFNDVSRPPLTKDIICDILIIGGGMAGISTAFNLKDIAQRIILIDKDKIGYGVTSHTTGKITYLQGSIYSKIEKMFDFTVAKQYLESQKEAMAIIKHNIDKYHIDCDYTACSSYIYTTDPDKPLTKERDFLTRAQIKYQDSKKLPETKIPCLDALKVPDTAVFHPLKYLMALKQIILDNSIQIYENTPALDLDVEGDHYVIKTPQGLIKTSKVLVCTHYPFFIIPGLVPLKLHLDKSYALAAKRPNQKFSAISIDKTVYSLRYHQDYLIFGGLSHNLVDKLDFLKEENQLINYYQSHFNQNPDYVWQTHDLMTHDYLPLIGMVSYKHPTLLMACGFNKWGMTNGTIAGQVLADLIMNKPNRYANLFSPMRGYNLEKTLNFIVNNFKIAKAFITTKLSKNKPFYQGAFVTNIDGQMCGVYIDENKKRHIVRNTCPHFKCSLIFNNADKTWDCQCHGSRFDIDGNLIEGPSVFSIKIGK